MFITALPFNPEQNPSWHERCIISVKWATLDFVPVRTQPVFLRRCSYGPRHHHLGGADFAGPERLGLRLLQRPTGARFGGRTRSGPCPVGAAAGDARPLSGRRACPPTDHRLAAGLVTRPAGRDLAGTWVAV